MALEQVIRSVQERQQEAGASPIQAQRRDLLRRLSREVRRRLVEATELDPQSPDARETARTLIQHYLAEEESRSPLLVLAPHERAEIENQVLTGIFGYGILTPFVHDETVTEIMVNGPERVFIEQKGRISRARDREGQPLTFADKAEMLTVIEKIVAPLNRKVDESDPIVDARLPDGSRVNIVLPPVALDGPMITIRKFPKNPYSLDALVEMGALTSELQDLLTTFVKARINIIVSGATASGKTTFLNALGMVIPAQERIVTVEDAAELKLTQVENLARMESRPPNIEGKGQITIRDLVRTSLRMRPDRVVVGEVRGGECLDMLQAMNTGHDGSLTTAHANSAQDLISRLETMVLMSGMELPVSAIRQQIASAVEVIVHLARLPGGGRRVVQVCEVLGLERGEVALAEIFRWEAAAGALVWTGRELTRTGKYERAGVPVPRLGEGSG
ncbi:MAG TPA: CpaF family protein [Symbiobacteriaceae bacterium]|nr:CpaF family protein [Symbiobacteriaceae bacterium]